MGKRAGHRPAAALLGVVALLLAAPSGFGGDDSPGMTELRPLVREGERAPSFTLNDLDGKTVAYRPGGGKPSLIVFWSAFCPLCRELTPDLSELAERRRKDLRFVSVNLDGKRFTNAIRAFLKEYRVGYPVLLDDIRDDFFIASDPYGISKTPTAVYVDGAGVVRGAYPAEAVREMIREIDQGKSARK